MIRRIVEIYGDSIMKGTLLDNITKRYSYKKDLLTPIEDSFPLELKNRSKFGCTIEKGEKMLDIALAQGPSCDTILLEYGGNDCDFHWDQVAENPSGEHFPHTPLARFESIYRSMIEKMRANGIEPIVMSLPPIDAEKYFAWFTRSGINKQNILRWLGDIQLIYRHQELYSLSATKLALELHCRFVDVRSAFLGRHDYKLLLCEDGIHPNESGYQLISDVFSSYVKTALS